MADRPDAAPLVARAMRLRAILDHLDTARGGEVHDRVHVTGPAREVDRDDRLGARSEEHASELQSLMRISYAVFCLKQNTQVSQTYTNAQYDAPHHRDSNQDAHK